VYQKVNPAPKTITLHGMTKNVKLLSRTEKKDLKRVKSFPTANNLANYRIMRAKARQTMKTSKRQSSRSFVSKINSRTSIKKVWSMVHKIACKKSAIEIHHLHVDGDEVTELVDISNKIYQTFSNNSSAEKLQ